MNKKQILALLYIIASFCIGLYFYPKMPLRPATHWGPSGQADGYGSKFTALLLLPIISLAVFLLFWFIPKIDPLKENIKKFQKHFDNLLLAFVIFFFYLYILTILWNLGWRFNMSQFLLPAFGIVFIYAGVLTENAKQNWFVGIKTPWTLSSENVWNKTNKLAGKLFKAAGVIAFLGILLPNFAMLFILVPAFVAAIWPVVYSYLEYKKENKK